MPDEEFALALEDLDAAIQRLFHAGPNAAEARRALNEAGLYTYALEQRLKDEHGRRYWDLANGEPRGETAQALTFVRGITTHRMVAAHQPAYITKIGELAPDWDFSEGPNYLWLPWDRLEPLITPAPGTRDKRELVQRRLAGKFAAHTFRVARLFLAAAPERLRR